MAPIPIALCGKSPQIAAYFIQLMRPEFEVVHACQSVLSAKTEFPPLLRGESTKPRSNQGSNANANGNSDFKIPKAVVVGGGFSDSEIEDMRNAEGVQKVPWLYLDQATRDGFASSDPMGVIVQRTKEAFLEKGFVQGREDEVVPGLWSC